MPCGGRFVITATGSPGIFTRFLSENRSRPVPGGRFQAAAASESQQGKILTQKSGPVNGFFYLRASKKDLSSALLSASIKPLYTFGRPPDIATRPPQFQAVSLSAHYIIRSTRAFTAAPRHMGHGSSVT